MAHGSNSAHLSHNETRREIVAYCRVSTDEQRVHGLGLEAQLATIQNYAERINGHIVAEYEEAATGRRDHLRNRPELGKALAHARRSGALLVFARWDRLSRNVSVTAQLLESSVDFVACDNPNANRLTIHILAAMAEYESRLKSERLKDVYALMKARGHKFRAGTITPEMARLGNEAACAAARARTKMLYADLVPIVVGLRQSGLSGDAVADELNQRGQRNQRGGKWTRGTVHMMLEREGLHDINALRPTLRGPVDDVTPYFHNRARAKAAYAGISSVVCRMYEKGKTTRYIANWLNKRGHKTINWNEWTTDAVVALLRLNEIVIRPRDTEEKARALRRAWQISLKARRARVDASFRIAFPLAKRQRTRGSTLAQIADFLNQRKVATPNSKFWHPVSVAALLRWNK